VSEAVLIERRAGVLSLTLNRPQAKNAITAGMFATMTEAFEGLRSDDSTQVVVIRGSGPDFSAGGDIKDVGPLLDLPAPDRARELRALVSSGAAPAILALERVEQPVLLAARGHVIGAAVQLTAVADLVLASETALFCIPQVKLAHTVDHGESYHLPRKVGLARAMEICLLGERFDATQALAWGLINRVASDADLDRAIEELAASLAAAPPVAVRGMKALLKGSASRGLEAQFAAEREMIGHCVATDDFVEAIRAFAQKRRPQFAGR
jgi:2-(1,2-epoxy-1,2-dihydrophenyl)acetyl-CoA isomerase